MRVCVPGMATVTILLSVGAGVSAMDDTAENALLGDGGCNACHALDHKMLGPAYQDIASKYRDETGAIEMLVVRVRNGSSGVWGPIPMMPVPPERIGDDDLKDVLAWILAR
jgi:cytochrome c